MNTELKQILSEKRAAFLIEEEKEFPDHETAQELQSEIFHIEKVERIFAEWKISQHTKEAKKLCDVSANVIETAKTWISKSNGFSINSDTDSQGLVNIDKKV